MRSADDRIALAAATDGRAKAFLLVNGFAAERAFAPEVVGADGETFTLYRLDDKNRRLAACGITALALPAPHPQLGECVALLWEGTATPAELETALATLPRYHRPQIVRHVEKLPRTETGKVRRKLEVEG